MTVFGFDDCDAYFHTSAGWSIRRTLRQSSPWPKGRCKNLLLTYFNLRDQPFGVTPDPSYLFDTPTHREALAGLLYGIHSGLGFIALTAEPGMGKTTILFEALTRLDKKARTVFLFQAIPNPTELFRALLIDLGEKDPQGTLIDLEMRLNEILMKQNESGQRLVVVLDEAQNLDHSVLEAVRMLSNFETAHHKLLQVILCGQQQLADRLAEPELLQLRQRISIFATLKPLTRLETANYIEHRLKVAGYESSNPLFTPEAVSLIAHYSGGIPRNINNLCFNALSIGCAVRKNVIDTGVVREVIGDLGLQGEAFAEPIGVSEADMNKFAQSDPSELRNAWPGLRVALIAALLVAAALTAGGWYLAHSGALHSPQTSRASSSSQNPPPTKDQAQVPAPAAPQSDSSAQASVTEQDDPPVRPSAASQGDSSPQDTIPSETQAATDAIAPAPPAVRPSKQDRKRYASKPRSSTPRSSTKMTPIGGVQVVEARRGQSFVGICVEKFDGCSSALLNRIIELNPSIADPHHLQAGQRIFLPVIQSQPERSNRNPSGV
jgi:general secretion pathway protein A